MNSREIILELEHRPHAIVQVMPNKSVIQKECDQEKWTLHVTNEPDIFLGKMKEKYQRKATFGTKYEMESFDHAIDTVNDIYEHYGIKNDVIDRAEGLNLKEPIYLVVHIHYITKN